MMDGREILLRPSMRKFESYGDCFLEVCAYSGSHKAYLNRQIILLLNSLDVKEEVFISMQDEVTTTLSQASTSIDEAIKLLQNFTDESVPMIELNHCDHTHSAIGAALLMLKHGFGLETEPLIRLVVSSAQQWVTRQLKTKARIPIDEGAYLIGVADETRELEYGEVFVQVSQYREAVVVVVVVVVMLVGFVASPCILP